MRYTSSDGHFEAQRKVEILNVVHKGGVDISIDSPLVKAYSNKVLIKLGLHQIQAPTPESALLLLRRL